MSVLSLWQSEFGEWRLPAADPFDDPTVIRVTVIGEGEMGLAVSLCGDLAVEMNVDEVRRLASVLSMAADQAAACRVVAS